MRSSRSARDSSWRTRSRVMPSPAPTSSSVCGVSPSSPNRNASTRRMRGLRLASAGDELLPEERVESSLRSQALAVALQALPDRERQVLVLRYGLADEEPKTLAEIGKRLGLTRERVRQIELESLRRLAGLREMQMVAAL